MKHQITSKSAQKLITDRNADWIIKNFKFYAGDHWQGGDGWVGPRLDQKHAKYAETMVSLEKIFLSKNVIASVVDAHSQAVIGREPHWNIQPRIHKNEEDDEDTGTLIQKEADHLIQIWLDSLTGIAYRDGDDTEIRPCSPFTALLAATRFALLTKRGTLRFLISPKAIFTDTATDSPVVPPMAPDKLAKLIHIQATNPVQATVHFDPKELEPIGVYAYEEESGEGGTHKNLMAELTYLNDEQHTVLEIVNEDALDDRVGSNQTTLQLNGNLLHFEFEIPLFINNQIQQAQKALNKAKTMESKNLDQGGFLERVILNAQAPGTWEKDEKTGDEKFIPQALEIGPGYSTFLQGIETERADGSAGVATPSVSYRNPTPPDTFIETAKDIEGDILMQVSQAHRGMEGNANTSGVSRVQARESFRQSLSKTETEVNAAIKWMLETYLGLIAALSGQPGRYDELAVTGNAQLDIGVTSSDEHSQAIAAYKEKLQSRETTMAKLGIDDVLAEVERINNDSLGGTSVDEEDGNDDKDKETETGSDDNRATE